MLFLTILEMDTQELGSGEASWLSVSSHGRVCVLIHHRTPERDRDERNGRQDSHGRALCSPSTNKNSLNEIFFLDFFLDNSSSFKRKAPVGYQPWDISRGISGFVSWGLYGVKGISEIFFK